MTNEKLDKTAEFYRERFGGSVFVIKAGGRIITNQDAREDLLMTIADFAEADIKTILVYGGGHAIDREMENNGISPRKSQGRRITNSESLPSVRNVMSGQIPSLIYTSMARLGLKDGLCLPAIPPAWTDINFRERDNKKDYGYDGTLPKVYPAPIRKILNSVSFLAVPSLAISNEHAVNINADNAAVSLAIYILARKLIFLSDVEGVILNNKKASVLTEDDIHSHIASGEIKGGMQVKMENCLEALDRGVRRVHILSGFDNGALKQEIYDPIGAGTMILRDSDKKRYHQEINLEGVRR